MANSSSESHQSITLPDNSGGSVYTYSALLGSLSTSIYSIYYAISHRELLALIAFPLGLGAAFLLLRSAFTSTPDSISVEGKTVVLTNVPSWSFWLEKAIVPLVITKRVEINKPDFQLEWLDQSLTWNDLNNGKSIHLANANEAKPLLAWLSAQDIPYPPQPS